MLRVVITVQSGHRAGACWMLCSGDKLTFGRGQNADVVFDDDCVLSSCHFRINVEQDSCRIEDLKSTNGTWVNEQPISSQTLYQGDCIRAGQAVFEIKLESSDPEAIVVRPQGLNPPPSPPDRHHAREKAFPQDLLVKLSRTVSGVWRGTQASEVVAPAALVERLSRSIPATLILDFQRTEMEAVPPPQDNEGDFLMANLPPIAAAQVSPRMIQPTSPVELSQWLQEGWGADGIIVLFSTIAKMSLLKHFQAAMNTTGTGNIKYKGMLGLCWPSILEAVLENGKPDVVNQIVTPFEAILLESPDAPGGWCLIGSERLPKLLSTAKIAFEQELPSKSNLSPAPDAA
jgi:hypothetical protein